MTSRFRILLNKISSQLSEQEIRSLVLMCEVPEYQRAGIKDGISLFENLIKRDIINEHKLDKLKTLLKNLTPKRRDLIKEIEHFENGGQTQDDASSTLTSFVGSNRSMPDRPDATIRPDIEESCCTLDCPCMVISCYKCTCKISWSYIVLTAFFFVCFLIVSLFWYANVPKVSEAITSDEHLKNSGPYILIAIVVAWMVCLLLMCCVKKRRIRRSRPSATSAENQIGMLDVDDIINVENRTYGVSDFRENRRGTSNSIIDNFTARFSSNIPFSRERRDDSSIIDDPDILI